MKLRQILSEKWKEALQAVLPIITIVLALSFTIAPLSPSVLLCFLMGAVLILVGMMFFTTGAETAMTPMGERIGTAMTKTKKLGVVCPELIRKFFRNSGVTSVIWGYTLSLCGFFRKLFAVFDFFTRF